MEFRYARHTLGLDRLEQFYTGIIGLEKLGAFEQHAGYKGLFLGLPDANWHIEFTSSSEPPGNIPDADDLLVFYVNTEIELSEVKRVIDEAGIPYETPKNPYWSAHGIMLSDPDGFNVVFSLKDRTLQSGDKLTRLLREKSIFTWNQALNYIQGLPYGRNQNRNDLALILEEGKGTCSSKHAFLKEIADLNHITQVQLMLGIYKMNQRNTPGIGSILKTKGLDYIPEAHCYLKLSNRRIDLTTPASDLQALKKDLLEEMEIQAGQVGGYKVAYHQAYLKAWLESHKPEWSFDAIWAIREACIRELEI